MGIRAQKGANEASASINAALSVLNGTTPSQFDANKSFNVSLNPFQFIIKLLQQVTGYDNIMTFLSEMIVFELPSLEDSVKISLMESIKELFSCSVNPLLSEDIIKNGVVLDLKTVDLLNILDRYPLSTENSEKSVKGSFFYFGTENFTLPDELYKCRDLNAVVWYVKHRAKDRTVWYGAETQGFEHEELTMDTKPSAKNGVVTLEYSEKASDLMDCKNNPMKTQVPHGNCLHVFLGNTKGVTNTPAPSNDELLQKIRNFQNALTEIEIIVEEFEIKYENSNDLTEKGDLKCEIEVLKNIIKALKNGSSIRDVVPNLPIDSDTGRYYLDFDNHRFLFDEYTYTHTKNDIAELYKELDSVEANRISTYQYREPNQNYYYHKSLFEFDTDYITSIKLFESKIIASQIVDILTGCFSATLNLSFEERLVQNEVDNMLTKIIETSDSTVSDCFFTFTNDEYNIMVDKTEKERLGRYTGTDDSYGAKIDYDVIYAELDKISSSATQTEQVTSISNAMNTISRTIKPEIYDATSEWTLNYNFLNNILRGLATSLVYNIISPKVYMLMAINLKIMGREPNFDLTTFIEMYKNLMINTIHGITDKIMERMNEWLLALVRDLVARLADRLMLEQSEYYLRLLTHSIMSFKAYFGSQNIDWNMSDAEYADIYVSSSNNETNTKC